MMPDLPFSPFDPAYQANPYPFLAEAQRAAPLHFCPALKKWVLLRHAPAKALLLDGRFGMDPRFSFDQTPLGRSMSLWFEFKNPPDHTRLRRLLARAFTPTAIAARRPLVEAITRNLLDASLAPGAFEFVEQVAYPLPVLVMADLLGVPEADRLAFKPIAQTMLAAIEKVFMRQPADEGNQAAEQFNAYFRELIAARRRQREDDLLSLLVDADEHGDFLSEDELVANSAFLFFATFETTVNMLGNALYTLLNTPGAWTFLAQDHARIPVAVEELLRYDTPVQLISRTCLEPATCAGRAFAPGEAIAVFLGAVNRDPEVFDAPHELRLTRAPNPHLAFATGIHACLGMALARMEAAVLLEELTVAAPTLRLATDAPTWKRSLLFRGLTALPLSVNP